VVNLEGLPVGYEVFDGNRKDVTTLEEMVELMEKKYGKAQRVWVFDRGIVSEENLDYLRKRGTRYIVGTLRDELKQFEKYLSEKDWDEVECGVEVKIVKHPEHGEEKYVLCRSHGRGEKERAMLKRQLDRLTVEFEKIKKGIDDGRLKSKDIRKIERRIGRWQGRYTKAAAMMDVDLIKDGELLVDLKIQRRTEKLEWAEKANGCYLLRTDLTEEEPKKLWQIYIQLNQAERAFRMEKSDLWMRPIFHQTTDRVQAHIFICFLALVMYKSLELWMNSRGLGNSPAKLLEEFKEIRSMDVVLPIKDHNPIRLCVVAKPDDHVQILLHRLGIKVPNRPKVVENVVKTLTV
jgi:transposase